MPTEAAHVLERAVRNVTWSIELWIDFIRQKEVSGDSIENLRSKFIILRIFHFMSDIRTAQTFFDCMPTFHST
jgi:hypothetical protein